MDEVRQRLLEDALEVYQGLVQEGSTNPAVRREMGRAYQGTGRIRQLLGKQEQAEKDYGQALDIQKKLADEFPDEPSYAQDLALSHLALGDLCRDQQGRTAEALGAYQQALEVLKPLADAHPEILEIQNSLAAAQNKLGVTYRDTGQKALAESVLQKGLEIRYALANKHPEIPAYQNALAESYQSLGDQYSLTGRRGSAEELFKKGVAIHEQLARAHPKDPKYQSSLAKSNNKLGYHYESSGKQAQAEEPYKQAFRICRQLASDHPTIPEYQTDLAVSYRYLGRVYLFTGRRVEAEALPVLGVSTLGLLGSPLGQGPVLAASALIPGRAEADSYFQKSVEIFERLIREYPRQVRITLLFADTSHQIGVVWRENGNFKEALPWFTRSIQLTQAVLQREPEHAEASNRLVTTYMDRAEVFVRLKDKEEAIKDWDRMIELGERHTSPNLRMYRAMALAHRGEHALATAEVEAILAEGLEPENALYNFACICSLSSAAVVNDASVSSAERKKLAEQYAARSVELLAKAGKAGLLKVMVDYLKNDTDLNPVRARDDFKKLIRQVDEDAKAAPDGEAK